MAKTVPPQNPQPIIVHDNSHVSLTQHNIKNSSELKQSATTSSNAPTLRATNTYNQRKNNKRKNASRWRRCIARRQQLRMQRQLENDMMDRIIARNEILEPSALMTEDNTPDVAKSDTSVDSIFCPPLLSSSTASNSSLSEASSISSTDSTIDTCSTTSTEDYDTLGAPPPGSVMDFWDTPFSPSEFHDFPHMFQNRVLAVDNAFLSPTEDDCVSLSSTDSLDDNFKYEPVLRRITANTRIVHDHDMSPYMGTTQYEVIHSGDLVDTGANFCMCNNLNMLVNVEAISPFGISMAATQQKSSPTCTHRGEFPIPMIDGSTFYTPMFYNPTASDCILSPQVICSNSNGYLVNWT